MDQLFERLKDLADFVIVACPPMVISDALFLAAKVDGVLVVIKPGSVRKGAALAVLDQFERTGVRVLGVVLNRIPLTGVDSYSKYQYYSMYYSDEEKPSKKTPSTIQEYLNFFSRKHKQE